MGGFGNVSGSSATGFGTSGSGGTTTKVDVFEPEQWDLWRKAMSGEMYDPQILQRYLGSSVDPVYDKMLKDSMAVAQNQYGPTASGYFSAATRLNQEQAVKDVAAARGKAYSDAIYNWENQKRQNQMAALGMSPKETIYEPKATEFNAESITGGNSGAGMIVGTPGAGSSYKPIASLDDMSKIWNQSSYGTASTPVRTSSGSIYTDETLNYNPGASSLALRDLYPSDEWLNEYNYGNSSFWS